MAFRRRSAGRELADGSFFLASRQRSRKRALWLFAAIVVLVFAAGAFRHYEREYFPNLQVERLERENEQLRADLADLRGSLERAMLDLEIASVTRSELERQLTVVNENHKQVKEELDFIKSAGEEGS